MVVSGRTPQEGCTRLPQPPAFPTLRCWPSPTPASAQAGDCGVSHAVWQLRLRHERWCCVHLDLWGCSALEHSCHPPRKPNSHPEGPHVRVLIPAHLRSPPASTTSQVSQRASRRFQPPPWAVLGDAEWSRDESSLPNPARCRDSWAK